MEKKNCNMQPSFGIMWEEKKLWEELIAYFPFTTVWIPDTTSKQPLVCVRNELDTTIQSERLQCWY
jgi:hypothetical protein